MIVELLKSEDLKSYKELIDECFGSSNNLEQYEKYHWICKSEQYKIPVGFIDERIRDKHDRCQGIEVSTSIL